MGDGDHMPEGGIGAFCGRSLCETVLLQCMYFHSGSTIRVLVAIGGTVVCGFSSPAPRRTVTKSINQTHANPPLSKKTFPSPKSEIRCFTQTPIIPSTNSIKYRNPTSLGVDFNFQTPLGDWGGEIEIEIKTEESASVHCTLSPMAAQTLRKTTIVRRRARAGIFARGDSVVSGWRIPDRVSSGAGVEMGRGEVCVSLLRFTGCRCERGTDGIRYV